jgi:very-short-patch-repair endonuclease
MENSGDINKDRGVRLIDFLGKLNQLRRKIYTDVNQYEDLIWFHEIPKDPRYCFTQAWGTNEDYDQDIWALVKKYDEPKTPKIPQKCNQWVDQNTLRNTEDFPQLFPSINIEEEVPNPDWDSDDPQNQDKYITVIKTLNLTDHSEISEEWDRYVEQKWLPWSDLHRKWEEVQNIYSQLFSIYQQQQKLGEEYELVLGVGLLTWKPTTGNPVRRHLITSKADLVFDTKSGKFTVNTSIESPDLYVELDMLELVDQPKQAKKIADEALKSSDQNPWNHSTTDPILSSLTNSLSDRGDGEYYKTKIKPEKRGLENKPIVEYAPALILRKRSLSGLDQALQTIRSQISAGTEMPTGFIDVAEGRNNTGTSHEKDTLTSQENQSAEAGLPQTVYFPKPSNEEQRKIVSKLDTKAGVLVQGPPGTGKSHTIANLICHFLATGKRVLVTAQTPRALKVLHEKLPKQLRPLCINLLGSGPEEIESLKSSVGAILIEQDNWNKENATSKSIELEKHISDLKSNRGKVTHQLRSIREKETRIHNLFNGYYTGTATQIAKAIKQNSKDYEWFQDEIHYDKEIPISKKELLEIRSELTLVPTSMRKEIGQAIPRPGKDLPSSSTYKALISEYVEQKNYISKSGSLSDSPLGTILSQTSKNNNQTLTESLSKLVAEIESVQKRPMEWLGKAVYDMLTDNDTPWKEMLNLSEQSLDNLKERARKVSDQNLSIPEEHEVKKVLADAKILKMHLEGGGKLGWGVFRDKLVKERMYLINEVKINGLSCDKPGPLELLEEHLDVLDRIDSAWKVWEGQVQRKPGLLILQVAELEELQEALTRVVGLYDFHQSAKNAIYAIQGVAEPAWYKPDEVRILLDTSRLVTAKSELKRSQNELASLANKIQKFSSMPNAHEICKEILPVFKKGDLSLYSKLILDIEKVIDHSDRIVRSSEALKKLENDAPLFVSQLYFDPNDLKWDDWLEDIEAAWAWARAKSWFNDFINADDIESLERQLHNIELDINEDTAELASLRSWKFCFERMSESIRRHLVGWQDNVRLIGKGTGKHAPKYRREAQRHLNECKEAIPAWVMPLHRVWDSVRPEPGLFDLIIVDEASQCGWQSLPLLYLAKRMIIVGDDQQISPQSVGVDKGNVQSLIDEYLNDFEQKDSFDAENSLFGHARRRFPAPIVLREHFRCVPEIIRFSNDLCYKDTPLIPLRQYPPQRLEPLIAKHITNGERDGSGQKVINRVEAEAVVDSIIECCKDSRYTGKTMGVIVLQGKVQATLIEQLLLKKIDSEKITFDDLFVKRRLICGDPYSFQGDERDVIFLSMVAAPNQVISALTKQSDQKRFNVAASRAQDQMWLFHSASVDELSQSCFRRKLLEHFINPKSTIETALGENAEHIRKLAHTANRQNESPPKPFDSWFEVDVALEIATRGYKIIPQVKVIQNKRIDMVVEGLQAKLAVECDGDHWHGPEKYDEDMERQRQLERCGWTFHRIRESEFYYFKESAMNKLWNALQSYGIHPIGYKAPDKQPSGVDNFGSEQNLSLDQNKSDPPSKIRGASPTPTKDEDAAYQSLGATNKVSSEVFSLANKPLQDTLDMLDKETLAEKSKAPEPSNVIERNSFPQESLTGKQAPYNIFDEAELDDPKSSRKEEVADGLCRIIEIEGLFNVSPKWTKRVKKLRGTFC